MFVESKDNHCGGTVRQLRKVNTDDLVFLGQVAGGGSPPKKKANVQQVPMQKEAIVAKQATAQAQLTGYIIASCLHA